MNNKFLFLILLTIQMTHPASFEIINLSHNTIKNIRLIFDTHDKRTGYKGSLIPLHARQNDQKKFSPNQKDSLNPGETLHLEGHFITKPANLSQITFASAIKNQKQTTWQSSNLTNLQIKPGEGSYEIPEPGETPQLNEERKKYQIRIYDNGKAEIVKKETNEIIPLQLKQK